MCCMRLSKLADKFRKQTITRLHSRWVVSWYSTVGGFSFDASVYLYDVDKDTLHTAYLHTIHTQKFDPFLNLHEWVFER